MNRVIEIHSTGALIPIDDAISGVGDLGTSDFTLWGVGSLLIGNQIIQAVVPNAEKQNTINTYCMGNIISAARITLNKSFDIHSKNQLLKIYPESEIIGWAVKRNEAKAWSELSLIQKENILNSIITEEYSAIIAESCVLSGGSVTGTLADNIVAIDNRVNEILTNSKQYKQFHGRMVKTKKYYIDLLNAATDETEINNILNNIVWPVL